MYYITKVAKIQQNNCEKYMKKEVCALEREYWEANEEDWGDWRWQLGNSGRAWNAMRAMGLADDSLDVVQRKYPTQATPFFLSLSARLSRDDAIIRQTLPDVAEMTGGEPDPFDERRHCHVPRLVHRYRDRALFITTGDCAAHCRHCMRKRNWGEYPGGPSAEVLSAAVEYVSKHPEIREILVSGGDPLTLEDDELERVMGAFARIDHVEVLRLGSRAPAVMPQRLTDGLGAMLESMGKPVFLVAHFNHPQELSKEAADGVLRMLRHGVPTLSQTVLLKGVNDDAETLRLLFTGLLRMRVKPYYLFHGDPIVGTMHFRTGVERGLELMAQLRGHVSGMALPSYSFDLPDGGGKIRLEPGMDLPRNDSGELCFDSFEGRKIVYR